MPPASLRLLTPQNAAELVAALNSFKRGLPGEVTFAMRGGGISFSAALRCTYDSKRVLCMFNGKRNMTTAFPVSSSAILRKGVPSLENSYLPPGIGRGEHETRWGVSGGRLLVYCSRVVKDDGLLVVWTDWRCFLPSRAADTVPLADRPVDVAMFGRVCPKV